VITIIFLGSGHDDPSGKERLKRSLQSLKCQHGTQPDFIAFEYARDTYVALQSNRPELIENLKTAFPKLGQEFICHFGNTLAYEGDLYQEIVTPSKSIWMLDGRKEDDTRVAGSRLVSAACSIKKVNLETWLLPRIHNWTHLSDTEILKETISVYMKESEAIASLSGEAAMRRDGLNASIQSGRESHMFESLKIDLTKSYSDKHVGVIIVGAEHLLDVPGSLFNLCSALGISVERRWPHEQ
jgi:hypothetical protein